MSVQVVQHERVKHNVPDIRPIEHNRSLVSDVAEIQHERGKVRRVQSTNSSFPERQEVDLWLGNASRARFCPVQVDAKTGNDKEEVYPGKREMNHERRDFRQPQLPTA